MPPRKAMVKAEGNSSTIFSQLTGGSDGAGSALGMPPKRVAMVSTGKAKSATAMAESTTAIRKPGSCGA